MKTETVKIEIPVSGHIQSCLPASPLKPNCRNKNGKPCTSHFKLVPKYMPFLTEFIQAVSWNAAEQTLEVRIAETPKFEAFQWFGTINKRYAESQKSSFVDLECDSLLLAFKDQCDKDVAQFKFRSLKVVWHDCDLSKESVFLTDVNEPLVHNLKIKYSDCEQIPLPTSVAEEGPVLSLERNEVVDAEWQGN